MSSYYTDFSIQTKNTDDDKYSVYYFETFEDKLKYIKEEFAECIPERREYLSNMGNSRLKSFIKYNKARHRFAKSKNFFKINSDENFDYFVINPNANSGFSGGPKLLA